MSCSLDSFFQFLDRSPTVFHAAKELMQTLAAAGFSSLKEEEKWNLEPGKGYFVCRGDALVAAFRIPLKAATSTTILASHTDSPTLKLKPQPELLTQGLGQFNTEPYGSPILHSWLDRDLIIAGKIIGLDHNGHEVSHIITLDDHPIIIAQLALHLDRSIADKGFFVNKQDHLKPVYSLRGKERSLLSLIEKQYNLKKIISFDLFLAPSQKSSYIGFEKELIASYRLDNLTSVYASLFALIHASVSTDILQVAFFWDHEEIGSVSYLGADSFFAEQLLQRICLNFKMGPEDFFRFKAKSLCLSIDAAHGFHPNFPEKYDPQNSAFLGKGVVLKFNANQKYATSSNSAAPIIHIAAKHNIPLQHTASRSDIPSGSTVGSVMAANLGIATVDLGISCWAMHSARETIAVEDEIYLCSLLKAVLEESMRDHS